jgi:hypothetical protein
MRCFHCYKEIEDESNMVLISVDGDFVCNKVCEKEYKKERAHFLDVIIHDDVLYDKWIYA